MSLPKEYSAGMITWKDPESRVPYTVILASDFGTTSDALEAWARYKEELGTVQKVYVTRYGIEGLPVAEDLLSSFVALGSTGAGLALSGCNSGYGGEGPHGSASILRELGIPESIVSLVFQAHKLRFTLFDESWLAEVDPDEL